jgi:hypothetical protein
MICPEGVYRRNLGFMAALSSTALRFAIELFRNFKPKVNRHPTEIYGV